LQAQDVIESAYQATNQVTVKTAVLWISGKPSSNVVVSDCNVHDKYAVFVFFLKLMQHLYDTAVQCSLNH
jgi:hypothetical protein